MTQGPTVYTAWIPMEFAVAGKNVDLKIDGTWSRGWKVVEAFNSLPSDYVRDRSRDYKSQREASDI